MEIHRLAAGDEALLVRAGPLFDHALQPEAVARFLGSDDHYILVATEDEDVIGFVTGVETTHPDKGAEMFLYELAVDERYRRKGYGTALVRALAEMARRRGCYGMWVAVEPDDAAALATYAAAGAGGNSAAVIFEWNFR